jgi:hydroxyacylglutathione hydrolase
MLIETLELGPVETNCYLYSEDGETAVIIDPATDAGVIINQLRSLKLEPVVIVNTHGHLDHVGANAELKKIYAVPICIGAGDAPYLGPDAEPVHRQDAIIIGPEAMALFQEYYKPSPPADILLHEGDAIPGSNLVTVETPGHTAGGISLLGGGVVFVGDTLFADSIGRADLCGGDEKTLIRSIKQRILSLPGDTEVLPGHGPPTTVGREKKHNPFLG